MSISAAARVRAHLSLVQPLEMPAEERELTPADRRAHRRLTVSELSWLEHVRLKYGPLASLIDLSTGGAQIETTNHRLTPGGALVIQIAGQGTEFAVPSRVLRCHVAGIGPQTIYRSALEFKQPIELPEGPAESSEPADCNPIHEHARLSVALRRASESHLGYPARLGGQTQVSAAALTAARAMIESPAGRRAGVPFSREIGRLLRAVTRLIESGAANDAVIAAIVDRLRRAVPAHTVRLVDSAGIVAVHDPDAIYFDVPSMPDRPPVKLLVEFPRGSRLEEWHLEFLRVASQLIALTNELEYVRSTAKSEDVPASRESVDPPGWNRLVVRYRDGRLLKGYAQTFQPMTGQVHVWSAPDSPAVSRITVPLAHLKAVFFVHDFVGGTAADGKSVDGKSVDGAGAGRRITVTFLDGEVIAGTTLTYSAEGPGFFVSPSDDTTNNERVFVVTASIRHVQFV